MTVVRSTPLLDSPFDKVIKTSEQKGIDGHFWWDVIAIAEKDSFPDGKVDIFLQMIAPPVTYDELIDWMHESISKWCLTVEGILVDNSDNTLVLNRTLKLNLWSEEDWALFKLTWC